MRARDLDPEALRLVRRAGPLLFGIYAQQENAGEMELRAGGSGIIVSPFTGITAKHVAADFLRLDTRFEALPATAFEAEFSCAVFQNPYPVDDDREAAGSEYASWQVNESWPGQYTDISLLQLSAEGGLALEFQRELPTRFFEWRLTPPPEGSMVAALGFPDAKLSADGKVLSVDSGFLFERGFVTKVHPERRERGMLTFPCFEVDRDFPPGMSGGPVFFEDKLCGVVSAGSTFAPPSYVATLWPMLLTEYGDSRNRLPFKQLLQAGAINSPGWSALEGLIEIVEDEDKPFCRLRSAE